MKLREQVYRANMELEKRQLVIYSWGNVSGIDRESGIVIIKPSGVAYKELTPENLAAVDMDGRVLKGNYKPSSDTATHLVLYRNFPTIGGVCHTHSRFATQWAQAAVEIPCFGTTHADYFYGPIPVTQPLSAEEIASDYERHTGEAIVRRFAQLDFEQMPAILAVNHGPFTWGANAAEAVEAAVVMEEVAQMALGTIAINPQQTAISQNLLDKHYRRKHGKNAYYGQF